MESADRLLESLLAFLNRKVKLVHFHCWYSKPLGATSQSYVSFTLLPTSKPMSKPRGWQRRMQGQTEEKRSTGPPSDMYRSGFLQQFGLRGSPMGSIWLFSSIPLLPSLYSSSVINVSNVLMALAYNNLITINKVSLGLCKAGSCYLQFIGSREGERGDLPMVSQEICQRIRDRTQISKGPVQHLNHKLIFPLTPRSASRPLFLK